MSQKVLITKIIKNGFSKSIGSAFGFGSWTIGATSIEVELSQPIDIGTKKGQVEYKKIKDALGKMSLRALNEDMALACKQDKELNASITQRELMVHNAMETE